MISKIYFYFSAVCILVFLPFLGCTSQQSEQNSVYWQERIEIAAGPGYIGAWRMNDSKFHYVDDPTVTVQENGGIGIGWVDQSRKNILFQRLNSQGEFRFEKPSNVSRSPETFSWLPDMVMITGGTDSAHVYMLWQEIVFSGGTHGGEAYFARSVDGGRTFSEPINLSNSIAGDGKGRLTKQYWHNGSLDLCIGPRNNLYAAWTEYEGKLWISRSTDGGQTFSNPLHVAGNFGNPARGPSLAVDSTGIIYLAWVHGENPEANIQIAKSTNNGRTFQTPRTAIANKGHSDAPEISVGSNQKLHLVYGVSPRGPFKKYDIRYTHAPRNSTQFEQPISLSNPQGLTYEMGHFPSISHDKFNRIYFVWELFKHPGERPKALSFTYSINGGNSFASPVVVPGSDNRNQGINGSQQGYLLDKLSVNNQGDIAIINSTFKRGKESHIWLIKGHHDTSD